MTTDTAPLSAEGIASRLTEIADLHSRTTQGTWKREGYVIFVEEGRGHEVARATPRSMHVFADADFLERAHKDVPWLVATCRDLSARVVELEAQVTDGQRKHIASKLIYEVVTEEARGERDAERRKRRDAEDESLRWKARATQAEAERDAWRNRARNHADTLRGIRKMDPLTEGDRIKTWCDDGLSGYTATVEVTTKELMDRALKAEAALSASQAREAGMREALTTDVVATAMQDAWNEFCDDSGCFPHCIELLPRRRLTANFHVSNFAEWVAANLRAALSPAQPAQDRIAAAVAFIDRNGPTPGADRFEGPEVTGPAQGADIAREGGE